MRYTKLSAWMTALAVLSVLVYFWRFTHISLRTGLSHDDLMNLYFACKAPFSQILKANTFLSTDVLRPMGALFYASFFHWFGFDGLPFRIFCYAVLWLNVGLTYVFVVYGARSREVALYSALLHCYHANYFPMYYGSGYVYDVLAFFFYYFAFSLYLRWRRDECLLNAWQCATVALLYACAVNSKEAAASLPLLMLTYELLYSPPRTWRWVWQESRAVIVTGCVGLVFLWSRFSGADNLLNHPDYRPVLTVGRHLESTASYLNELTNQGALWTPERSAVFLAALFAIALIVGDRRLWFAWALYMVGSLPVVFVSPRGVGAYYIPLVGLAMFAAILLVRGREFLARHRSPAAALVSQALLFCLVFGSLWRWQIRNQRRIQDHWDQKALIETTVAQFRRHPEWFRPGSSLLILNDPFPDYEWATSFIALLMDKDKALRVHTWAKLEPKPSPDQIAAYTHVVEYREGVYREADRARTR